MNQAPGTRYRNPATRASGALARLRLVGVLVFILHLSGCASSGLPTAKESTEVGAGEKVIVLVRVVCTVEDGQGYEPFSHSLIEDNISFGLGSFETGGEPRRLGLLRFLSPESRKDGWTYFVVPHGIHYLAVYPPRRTDILTYERAIKSAPRWRIDIPDNARLVYAGTLHLTGESSQLIFGGRILNSIRIDDMSATNEEEWARKLLTEGFPGFGDVQTALLSLHQGPTILRAPLPSSTR